jgi:hypothetical protein
MKLDDIRTKVAKMPIKHPDGELLGIEIHLTGQDTKQFRAKAREIAKSMVGKQTIDLDTQMAHNDELVASCVVGWSDDEFFGGEYSPERAHAMITDPDYAFVREQVELFIADRKNFFRPAGGKP